MEVNSYAGMSRVESNYIYFDSAQLDGTGKANVTDKILQFSRIANKIVILYF